MTHPISNERVTWLRERQKVVNRCVQVTSTQMHALEQGGQRQDLSMVLRTFREEQLAIEVELRVLVDYFDVKP